MTRQSSDQTDEQQDGRNRSTDPTGAVGDGRPARLRVSHAIALLLSLTAGVFWIDAVTPLGVAGAAGAMGGVPYVLVVLASLWLPRRAGVFAMAVLCTLLMIAGFFVSPPGGEFWQVVTNRSVAVFAIWVTALLGASAKHSGFLATVSAAISEEQIATRKQAEEELRQSEERYRAIVEEQTEWIGRFLPDGTRTFVNQAYCDHWGKSRAELVGVSLFPLLSTESLERLQSWIESATPENPTLPRFEHTVTRADGRTVWQQWSIRAIFDDAGQLLEVQSVGRDVTERRLAEEALRASEARYRAIIEDQTELICRNRLDATITFVNDAYCRYFNRTREELIGNRFLPVIPEEDWPAVREHFAHITPDNPVATHEHRVYGPNGELRWNQWTNRGIFDDTGQVIEFQGAGRDITVQKQTAEALQTRLKFEQLVSGISARLVNTPAAALDDALEEVLQLLVSFLDIDRCSIFEFGDDWKRGRLTHSAAAPGLAPAPLGGCGSQLSWLMENLVNGKTMAMEGGPDDLPDEAADSREYCLKHGIKASLAIPLIAAGTVLGAIGFVSLRGERTWDEELVQRLSFVGEILANALERKRVEEKLRLRDSALESAGNGIMIADALSDDMPIVYTNPAFERVTGYSSEEAVGKNARYLQGDDQDQPELDEIRRALRECRDVHVTLRNYRKDGALFWNELLISPVPDNNGRVTHFIGVQNDVTERKAAERELRDNEQRLTHVARLSTMGAMVAGISHELGQPLYAITNYSDACATAAEHLQDGQGKQVVDWSRRISEQANIAGTILRRLRDFARPSRNERVESDLNDIIRQSVEMTGLELRDRNVRIELQLPEPLPSLFVDRVQILQVMINLLRNSWEAMEETPEDGRLIDIHTDVTGTHVTVAVRDSGSGFGKEGEHRLFDQFYSTKTSGLGLGLAISRSIIESHQGKLWSNSADTGAVFWFALPISGGGLPSERH